MPVDVRTVLGVGLMISTAWLIGCRAEQPQATPPAEAATPAAEESNEAAMTEPASASDDTAPMDDMLRVDTEAAQIEIEAALAELSPADRELAEKQKICPVGGGPLGGMGAPIKVSVAGHEVFICCEGCEEPLKSDPEKYLAKIGLEPANNPVLPQ